VDGERRDTANGNDEPSAREPEIEADFGGLRDHVPAEIRNVSFPAAVRGYDRRAVDAYVKQVNTVIAELEVSRSPQAAVKHALDRVGRQTSGILQQARESADAISESAWAEADRTTARANSKAEEITAGANAAAEETTSRAKAEAEELLARSRNEAAERLQRVEEELAKRKGEAEARLRELDTGTEAIRRQRAELVEEVRGLAARLEAVASEAGGRFTRRQPDELHEPAPADDRLSEHR
jgi:DivIVA domain-containing protein